MSANKRLVAAYLFSAALLVTACSETTDTSDRTGPAAAVRVATRYADTHFPKGTFQPDGAALDYHVGDAGAAWKIELQPAGYMGGGLLVTVRKRDLAVISALRTQ